MPERYVRTKPAVVGVETPANERIANRYTRATVRLEMLGPTWFLTVKPYCCRREYRLPLWKVADIVCWKIEQAEAQGAGLRKLNRHLNKVLLGRR